MFRYLVIVVLLLSSLYAKASYIEAIGYGNTKSEALKSAFSDVVSQYIGVVVDSKNVVKNGKLIEDKILTFSNGYIKHYKLISATHKVGLWQVKIKALVKEQEVMKKIISEKISAKNITNSEQRYARLVSQIKTKFDAEDIFISTMKELLSWNTIKRYLQPKITKFFIDEDGATRYYVPVTIEVREKLNKYSYNNILNGLRILFKELGGKKVKLNTIGYKIKNWLTTIEIINLNGKEEFWKFPNSYKVIYPFISFNIKWANNIGWFNYNYLSENGEEHLKIVAKTTLNKEYVINFLDKEGKILKTIKRSNLMMCGNHNCEYNNIFQMGNQYSGCYYGLIRDFRNDGGVLYDKTIKIPLSIIKKLSRVEVKWVN
jgi:hypothetical protein